MPVPVWVIFIDCDSFITEGFSFDIELILLALKNKIDITEIPVTYIHELNSNIKIFSDSANSWSKYSSLFSDIARLNNSLKYSILLSIVSKSLILFSIFLIFWNKDLALGFFQISGFSLSFLNCFKSNLSEVKSNSPPQQIVVIFYNL